MTARRGAAAGSGATQQGDFLKRDDFSPALTIVDTFARVSRTGTPVRRCDRRGDRQRVGGQVGGAATVRGKRNPEFRSRDLHLWSDRRGVMRDFSQLLHPTTPSSTRSTIGTGSVPECSHPFLSLQQPRSGKIGAATAMTAARMDDPEKAPPMPNGTASRNCNGEEKRYPSRSKKVLLHGAAS